MMARVLGLDIHGERYAVGLLGRCHATFSTSYRVLKKWEGLPGAGSGGGAKVNQALRCTERKLRDDPTPSAEPSRRFAHPSIVDCLFIYRVRKGLIASYSSKDMPASPMYLGLFTPFRASAW